MQVSVAEFLEKVGKLRKTQEKVNALKANDSYILRVVLQGAFDPTVKWLLPEGEPPYKPNDLQDQEHVLINEAKKILYFVEGFHDTLPSTKREQMFIELLERIDPKDAKLLCSIKEKKLPFNGITVQHVKEAFPGMIQNEQA
jgi:hypothetical protein